MDGIYQFGLVLIQWLQTWSPALDGFMKAVTFMGTIEFYIIFVPALYWTVNQTLGMRTLFLLILTDAISTYLKQLLHQPRPYWIGGVKELAVDNSYGIPSSHASNSLAVWGMISLAVKRSWVWIFSFLLVLLIGLSRPYLGVHFPHDVLGGWLLGLFMLLLFLRYESNFIAWWARKQTSTQIWLGFVSSLALIAIGLLVVALISPFPDDPAWASYSTEAREISRYLTLGGFLFGATAGMVLMQKYARFSVDGPVLQRILRYILGMVGVFALYLGLDVLFAMFAEDATLAGYILRYIRYATVAFWAAFVAPWVFLKVGLAQRP
jgi:membrane-associated phospholipid phosphatase